MRDSSGGGRNRVKAINLREVLEAKRTDLLADRWIWDGEEQGGPG